MEKGIINKGKEEAKESIKIRRPMPKKRCRCPSPAAFQISLTATMSAYRVLQLGLATSVRSAMRLVPISQPSLLIAKLALPLSLHTGRATAPPSWFSSSVLLKALAIICYYNTYWISMRFLSLASPTLETREYQGSSIGLRAISGAM